MRKSRDDRASQRDDGLRRDVDYRGDDPRCSLAVDEVIGGLGGNVGDLPPLAALASHVTMRRFLLIAALVRVSLFGASS